jgi:biopolymer transport protein ExbB/TolQ
LAAGILSLIHLGPFRQTIARRYVSHPVECVEVLMFCCALAAFASKLVRARVERQACQAKWMPAWDGRPAPITDAATMLSGLGSLPARVQGTWVVQRLTAILHFLSSRGAADDLDDQLRSLADNDALALESSYSLTRFITWAIPILGFLGTVLGITESISGVTPEKLEQDLSQVTDGLALAFDATALGLALTMVAMFLAFLVERVEQSILESVDECADRELAHRFERTAIADTEFTGALRQNTKVLLDMTEQLVQRQATVWANALDEAERRRAGLQEGVQQRLTSALESVLDRTAETHSRRLAALEKQAVEQSAALIGQVATLAAAVNDSGKQQQTALANVGQGIIAQAQVLTRLQDGEKQLIRLQEGLHQNLTALAGAGAFEQAVHNLTAAIHLMTAKSGTLAGPMMAGRSAARPGAAA